MKNGSRRSLRILIEAIRKKDTKTLKNILRKGADVNGADYDGNCPIHHAVIHNNIEALSLLLDSDAEVDKPNASGLRAYDYACDFEDFASLEVLLKHNAKCDVKVVSYLSIFAGDVVKEIYRSIDVDEVTLAGYNALHLAVQRNDLLGVQELLLRGADVNSMTDRNKYTSLHLANSSECIEMLLQAGADPNLLDHFSCSPLYSVLSKKTSDQRTEQSRMIEILLKYGADGVDVFYAGQITADYDYSTAVFIEGLIDVLRYMALTDPDNHCDSKIDQRISEPKNALAKYYDICLEEIKEMRAERIRADFTYFDLARLTAKEVFELRECKKIVKTIGKSEELYNDRYRNYYEILRRHFDDVVLMMKVRKKAAVALSLAVRCIDPQHLVTEKVLSYLGERDMTNLVVACKINSSEG